MVIYIVTKEICGRTSLFCEGAPVVKKDKKLIVVRGDLLEKLSTITAKEGKTMYAFTNEIFEQVLKAYEMQVSLAELVEFYNLMKFGKDSGSVILPSELLDYMISKLHKKEKEELLQKWYDSGVWYGKYLRLQSHEQEPLQLLQKLLQTWMWNITDFSFDMEKEKLVIRCISPHLTMESTESLAKFLEGIFHSLNFEIIKNECLKGIIMMELARKEKI